MILGLRGHGTTPGSAAAVLQKPYPMSAIALSSCYVYRIPLDRFLYLMETDTVFNLCIQQTHCHEAYHQAIQLADSMALSARQRLEQLFHQMLMAIKRDLNDGPVKLQLPLKYREIAQLVAVTPEHLSRVLKQMEDDGTIEREKDTLTVFDLNRLYYAAEYCYSFHLNEQ